jgi:dihydroneopterin aldolase
LIATVGIEELQIRAVIGVDAEERMARQPLRLSVTLDYDATVPMDTDDISDAVDYSRVAAVAERVAGEGDFHLLESLCGTIVTAIRAEFPQVTRVEVEVRKPRAIVQARSAVARVTWKAETSKVLPESSAKP